MSALVLSAYYAGYTIGAVYCSRIIERVGHIRAYAALARLAVMATAIMPLAIICARLLDLAAPGCSLQQKAG